MVDIRQPRNEGLPSIEALQNPRVLHRTLEMLYQRTGATQDQPFEDHMAGRDNQAQIEELKDDIRRSVNEATAGAEDVRGESLGEISRLIDELRGFVRELESRPVVEDEIASILARLDDVAALAENVQTDFRDALQELSDQIDNIAIAQETTENSAGFTLLSLTTLASLTPGAAGLMSYSGAGNALQARTLTAGQAISITNGTGAGGNPTVAVDITVAAPSLTTITGSGADADINNNFTALETAINALRTQLGA